MCRTVNSVLQSLICAVQMLTRVFITAILMIENVMRLLLQTIYNILSFVLQMISLLPICVVFLVTSRLKCFMCGGGGPCQGGGSCDCLMSGMAILIVFFILRATGLLDKIFYKIGYTKAKPQPFTRFVPTPGDITECSRNDSTEYASTTPFADYLDTTTEITETPEPDAPVPLGEQEDTKPKRPHSPDYPPPPGDYPPPPGDYPPSSPNNTPPWGDYPPGVPNYHHLPGDNPPVEPDFPNRRVHPTRLTPVHIA